MPFRLFAISRCRLLVLCHIQVQAVFSYSRCRLLCNLFHLYTSVLANLKSALQG